MMPAAGTVLWSISKRLGPTSTFNVTGAVTLNVEVGPKRLEMLHNTVPAAGIIGVLINPDRPGAADQSRRLQESARALGLQIHISNASSGSNIDAAFSQLAEQRAK